MNLKIVLLTEKRPVESSRGGGFLNFEIELHFVIEFCVLPRRVSLIISEGREEERHCMLLWKRRTHLEERREKLAHQSERPPSNGN